MMNLVLAPRAEQDINDQLAFGTERFGRATSERTLQKIFDYLENVLVHFPRSATFNPDTKTFETWIPKTPFVVFYRLDEQKNDLIVVALFHHAQDRSEFVSDADE
jgi:plasmid stabilization system protein ParE